MFLWKGEVELWFGLRYFGRFVLNRLRLYGGGFYLRERKELQNPISGKQKWSTLWVRLQAYSRSEEYHSSIFNPSSK